MSIGAVSGGISTFGIVNEATSHLIQSDKEDKKAHKTSVNSRKSFLEQKREERIDNLQERLEQLASGRSGCLKFLKVVSVVAGSLTAAFTGGASLAAAGAITAAMKTAATTAAIVSAVTTAVSGVGLAVENLKEAMRLKKLTLTEAEGKQILAIIEETQKWVEDEKSNLDESNKKEANILEEHKQMLQNLNDSFSAMVQIKA